MSMQRLSSQDISASQPLSQYEDKNLIWEKLRAEGICLYFTNFTILLEAQG